MIKTVKNSSLFKIFVELILYSDMVNLGKVGQVVAVETENCTWYFSPGL